MKFKGMSRSHLFLIELIVVILFFSFASVIALQVFTKSHELANNSTALNGAIMTVQTAAETDKNTLLKNLDSSKRLIYFNKDWEITDSSDETYILTSTVTLEGKPAGTMAVFNYAVTADNKIIYQLQAKKYYSEETFSSASTKRGD